MLVLWTTVALALDLDEAQSLAVERAAAVQIAASQREVAQADALSALSGGLPSAAAFANANAGTEADDGNE